MVRTYWGRTQADAAVGLANEAGLLAPRGYVVTSQSWGEGRPGVGRVVALGLFANSIRPDGALTVMWTAGGDAPSDAGAPDARPTMATA